MGQDSSVPVTKWCRTVRTLRYQFDGAEMSWVRSVLGPKCLDTIHPTPSAHVKSDDWQATGIMRIYRPADLRIELRVKCGSKCGWKSAYYPTYDELMILAYWALTNHASVTLRSLKNVCFNLLAVCLYYFCTIWWQTKIVMLLTY